MRTLWGRASARSFALAGVPHPDSDFFRTLVSMRTETRRRSGGAAGIRATIARMSLVYFATVILFLLVLPVISVTLELSRHASTIMFLTGKWFVFWSVGVRLFLAGVRQVVQPRFTAEEIFGVHDRGSFAIVREVGFANLSMGLLGICSVVRYDWIVPAAIAGGLYYGLAGIGHVFHRDKNAKEQVAMISDGFIFLVLLAAVYWRW